MPESLSAPLPLPHSPGFPAPESDKRPLPDRHLYYGGDYNPEQWPESVWQEDMALMQESGANLMTIGVFSWARLEPKPGEFDFGWMDRLMDLLHQSGVAADLATATASPPAWLARLHPESLPVNRDGITYHVGGRQQYCPNSPHYRHYAARLVRNLALRYKDHPALHLWHINNEYAGHIQACYCGQCAAGFRLWLKTRYASLEDLNTAWGTAFWSQNYADWEEIGPPRRAPTFPNPSQTLDYKRFMNRSILSLCLMEKAILREVTPKVPITTNFMGYFEPLDYFEWGSHLDFTCWDSYPDPAEDMAAVRNSAFGQDLTRSTGGGRPFILMEQATSQVNWREVNMLKRPGAMRVLSYQSIARGGDGICFFQWRAARAGAEKFHSAMVPHADPHKSRVFAEMKELGLELKRLGEIAGSRVKPKAALLLDWQSRWAVEQASHPARIDTNAVLNAFYNPFFDRNIAVDLATPEADLSGYSLIVVPLLHLLRPEGAKNLEAFVERGGILLVTYFSGIVDGNDHILLGGYPALLRKTLGLWVEEWDPYPRGKRNTVDYGGRALSCESWSDLLHLEGAEALAAYTSDFYAGRPAFTRNRFGKGRAYYLGTQPGAEFLDAVMDEILKAAGLAAPVQASPHLEAAVREKDGRRYLFLLNHAENEGWADLGREQGECLLTGGRHAGKVTLEGRGVRILRLD